MPRIAVENNQCLAVRVNPEDKALILRAATLRDMDYTSFVLQSTLSAARSVIEQAEHQALSERDNLVVLAALEHPPAPNARLLAAAVALPVLP